MDAEQIRQKVGQCLMVGIPGPTLDPATASLLDEEGIGNVVLFARNTPDPPATAHLTDALQELARRRLPAPMLISIDQEGGTVLRLTRGATPLPSAMALGAAGRAEDVTTVAAIAARELRAVGVNMNLAPVLDVNNNARNPVVGTRSYGEDPARVAALGRAAIAAFREHGVAPVAKHFPGHGDTDTDSHLALPVLSHSRERLDAVELVPFRAAIADRVEAIMMAHLAVASIDPSGWPSSLSAATITGLLRHELGFEGIVCTDCLEMAGAAAQVDTAEAAVRAFEAGADLILISHTQEKHRAAAQALRAACESGRISGDRLERSTARIARLKTQLAGGSRPSLAVVGSAAHRKQVDAVAGRAITQVRNQGLLPLRPGARIGVISFQSGILTPVESSPDDDRFMAAAHARGLATGRTLPLEPDAEACAAAQAWAADSEVLIVATRRASQYPAQLRAARALAGGRPTVLVALREPYDLGLVPEAHAALAAYGDVTPLAEAALAACFGELAPTGRLPVTVPGLSGPRG
jgi:beta-N-acetylhexosaminidase